MLILKDVLRKWNDERNKLLAAFQRTLNLRRDHKRKRIEGIFFDSSNYPTCTKVDLMTLNDWIDEENNEIDDTIDDSYEPAAKKAKG